MTTNKLHDRQVLAKGACVGDPVVKILTLLVEAGATPRSAACAAVVLDRGGSVREAGDVLEFAFATEAAPVAASVFDAELLLAEARRAAERVEVRG
jgi:hypothetical protein